MRCFLAKSKTGHPKPALLEGPREADIDLELILEPELPAREKMSEEKMIELMDSMTDVGLLYPLLVVERGAGYEISDGHRRFIAAQRLGWPRIRCRIFAKDGLEIEACKVAANLEREDWNPAEEAIYYRQLVEKYNLDEAGLCKLVKRSPAYISSRWKLYDTDPEVFQALRDGRIPLGVAQELNRVPIKMYRLSFLQSALLSGTSARVVKGWVEQWKATQMPGVTSEIGEATTAPSPPVNEASLIPPATVRACVLCGGYRDPQNLTDVTMHTWEWESILSQLRKLQQRPEVSDAGSI